MLEHITAASCVVEQAILHVVDRSKDSLELADFALDLEPDACRFIAVHIADSLPSCHVGVFEQRNQNQVSRCCEAIMEDESQLVPQSQALARRLYDHAVRKSIKSGTFWVVVFRRKDEPARYLALLKMDETSAPTHEVDHGSTGCRIRFRVSPRGLPGEGQKVDKVAFILPPDTSSVPYDLKFLDRVRTDRGVAKYFREFLSCRPPQSDRDKSLIFNRQVELWIQENRETLPETLREQHLREVKYSFLRNNTEVDVRQFAAACLGSQNIHLQDSMVQRLRDSGLHDPSFIVDLPPRIVGRRTLRFTDGVHSVEVSGTPEAVKALVDVQEPGTAQDTYVATIRARVYDEKTR